MTNPTNQKLKIVLLAHSHVGAGAYDAIYERGDKIALASGYAKTESIVPAPNLIRAWREHGHNIAVVTNRADYGSWPTGDVLVSANWRHIIPEDYYSQFPLAVNFHGANTRLPRYRGRRPIQRQIADGQRGFFLTCHRLSPEVDAGEILAQSAVRFPCVPTQSMVYCSMRLMARDLTHWLLENYAELKHPPDPSV